MDGSVYPSFLMKGDTMNYTKLSVEAFRTSMMCAVRVFLPDNGRGLQIQSHDISKGNDVHPHGISFRAEESNKAPIVYIDRYYEQYLDGSSISDLARQLADEFEQTPKIENPPDIDMSWDSVKDRLGLRLYETKRNSGYLKDKVTFDAGCGLSLVPVVVINDDNRRFECTVTTEIAEAFGLNDDDLMEYAFISAPLIDEPVLEDLEETLTSFLAIPENYLLRTEPIDEPVPMYLLTNKSGLNGAAALFYPGIRQKIGHLLGKDYYVLPSSLQELIIVPERDGISAPDLKAMVTTANRSVVMPENVLSDNVFKYDRDTGIMRIV